MQSKRQIEMLKNELAQAKETIADIYSDMEDLKNRLFEEEEVSHTNKIPDKQSLENGQETSRDD